MAHEITETDGLVLLRKKAWHGLGFVVEQDMSPREALTIAGLDWGVEQRYLTCQTMVTDPDTGKKKVVDVTVPGHVANYRMNDDVGEFLGVVSDNYQPVQNINVADFCSALAETGNNVTIESAGSIRGGKKVWFLCHAGSFEIGKGDVSHEYLLISNGHDGLSPYRFTPTGVRVVCSNTCHFAIGASDTYDNIGKSALVLKHTRNVLDRVEEAKEALKQYGVVREKNIKIYQGLAKESATSDEFKTFFLECYTNDFGEIPTESDVKAADGKKAQNVLEGRRARSKDAYGMFAARFDDEREIAGASWWNAANAYSGLIQHDKKTRGKDEESRVLSRQNSNMFGLNQQRTQRAMALACSKAFAS